MSARGDGFGFTEPRQSKQRLGPYPIRGEFGGSAPDALYTSNRECAWNRWRRGLELATANASFAAFEYPFRYEIPVPSGVPTTGGNAPFLAGVFKGFPTRNKELGMHWAAAVLAGSLRFDNLQDQNDVPLSIASVTDSGNFWRVQLAGTYDQSNPLPPPLFVPIPGPAPDLTPLVGDILEDRVIESGGIPVTSETINPNTGTRYGYTSAVLDSVEPYTGVIVLRKQGSVESTPDAVFVTPATRPPQVGRFFINGAKYCCSCQDFNRRQYYYVSTVLGKKKSPSFPRTPPSTIKPGRYEVMTTAAGQLDDRVMTSALENRVMTIVSPSGYELPTIESRDAISAGNIPSNTNRDFPGIFSDFGAVYTRGTELPEDPSLPGARAEGMVKYNDYDTLPPEAAGQPNQLIQLTDRWTPILDEFRYCKHIYAMKYTDDLFPPEPSDVPVLGTELVAWEQNLVSSTQRDQKKAFDNLTTYGLSYMDVPPFNCQSPMMMPMVQKLFNIPSDFIKMSGFTMFDRNGNAYIPSSGETPAND